MVFAVAHYRGNLQEEVVSGYGYVGYDGGGHLVSKIPRIGGKS
jgi:hypothetical protein